MCGWKSDAVWCRGMETLVVDWLMLVLLLLMLLLCAVPLSHAYTAVCCERYGRLGRLGGPVGRSRQTHPY